ncbi:MAG TPA: response regulator [Tepidisphaeraceae bacterium]|jgi:DNA-binding NtrC family response regulator|nr:response regulator [Tepidisphaeraceae bacterium]
MDNLTKISILLAEDHDDTRVAMAKLMRLQGFVVHEARTADEARRLAESNRYNLLVSDLGLSDESGESLMSELHSRYGLIGIAVSGHTSRERVDGAGRAGFSRFVAKPFHFPSLLAAIRELTN